MLLTSLLLALRLLLLLLLLLLVLPLRLALRLRLRRLRLLPLPTRLLLILTPLHIVVSLMLHPQIVLQAVRKHLVHQHTTNLEILLQFLALPHFLLVGLAGVGVGVSEVSRPEEVEERLRLDMLGDHPLLTRLLVLLLLLDLFHSEVLGDPLDVSALRLDRRTLLEVELLPQLLVLHNLVLPQSEHNRKIVTLRGVLHMHMLHTFQQRLVLLAHLLLDHGRIAETLPPVSLDLPRL